MERAAANEHLPVRLEGDTARLARRCRETSVFSRSTTSTGMRAIDSPKTLSRP